MSGIRPKLYRVALVGLAVFAALVLIDTLRPGLFPPHVALGASLGLALCGMAVIATRPRTRRVPPHEARSQDFTAALEERRKLAEEAAQRPPRLPPD